MPQQVVTSYPSKHVPILQSDTVNLTFLNADGVSEVVGILPLIDGTITLRLNDDTDADFSAGVAYAAIAGIPIIGRIIRVFAAGTTLTNAQMVGLLIQR